MRGERHGCRAACARGVRAGARARVRRARRAAGGGRPARPGRPRVRRPRRPARCPEASPGRSATSPTPTAPTTRRTRSSAPPRSSGCRSRSASPRTSALGARSAIGARRQAGRSSTAAARCAPPTASTTGGWPSSSPPRSPQWLARSPDDFDWELADGVLCVSRERPPGDGVRARRGSAPTPPTSRRRCARSASRRSTPARRSAARRSAEAPSARTVLVELDPRADDLRAPARRRRVVAAAVPRRWSSATPRPTSSRSS